MSDAFEDRARELAHSLPLCDFGSSQAILAMAQAFREDAAENAALRAKVEHYAEICGRCAHHVEAAHQKRQAEIEQREHDAEATAEMEREDG